MNNDVFSLIYIHYIETVLPLYVSLPAQLLDAATPKVICAEVTGLVALSSQISPAELLSAEALIPRISSPAPEAEKAAHISLQAVTRRRRGDVSTLRWPTEAWRQGGMKGRAHEEENKQDEEKEEEEEAEWSL